MKIDKQNIGNAGIELNDYGFDSAKKLNNLSLDYINNKITQNTYTKKMETICNDIEKYGVEKEEED